MSFVLVLLCLAMGASLRRTGVLKEGSHLGLNAWLVYVAVPSAAFLYVPRIEWNREMIWPVLMPCLVWAGSWLMLGRLPVERRDTRGSLILGCGLGNTSFVGFPLCLGNVMATNPVWRKRISEWREQIAVWLRRRTETQLLLSDILVDFRHVWGDAALSQALRRHVMRAIAGSPTFVSDMFTIEADHGAALGWFGRLRSERDPSNPLSVAALSALGVLFGEGEMTIGALAAHERVQPPSMTRTVNCLVEEGYVARRANDADGRQVLIDLTEKGREILLADRRRRDVWLARRLRELTTDERDLLRQAAPILQRLATTD